VRITYDRDANAAHVHLTSTQPEPGRITIPAEPPAGVSGFVILDWKDDHLVGIEVLDADTRLHPGPARRSRRHHEPLDQPLAIDTEEPIPSTPGWRSATGTGTRRSPRRRVI
jgi:Protein of unknown function (DUF2283)